MSTSSDSAESSPLAATSAGGAESIIHDRVVDIANASSDRSEFLKRLADELRTNFHVAIVAVQASHWSNPMMLVVDDLLCEQLERDTVRSLLTSATAMPVACDVAVRHSVDALPARGIHVELNGLPERASVLLVYPSQLRPSPSTQVQDLKQLSLYAQSTRNVVAQVPVDGSPHLLTSESGLPTKSSSEIAFQRRALRLFHLDLDLKPTCYRIANESRRLLGCDRVTVLVPRSGRFRVRAVSGVAVVDSRSNAVRTIEQLTRAANVIGRPLMMPSEELLPPQIQNRMDDYLDDSGVMSSMLLPLYAPDPSAPREGIDADEIDPFNDQGDLVGVMVLDYFAGQVPSTIGPAMQVVAGEATLALRNSLEHHQVFGLRLWKRIGASLQSSAMPWAVAGMLVACALLISSMIVQVDHYVVASGHVEPTSRRDVFANVDGIVSRLHVADGQTVKAGDVLLELENADLENRAESLAGEIQTASKRLASIRTVRLSGDTDPAQSSRLALEQRQLESELTNLRAQHQVVRDQQDDLKVVSPIDGMVVAWQLERRLTDRPVARGNLLVSVADRNGPWSLKLKVPDRNAGPILESMQANSTLPAEFAVATCPEASFAARLDSLGTAARLDESGQHVVDATASVHGASLGGSQEKLGDFAAQDVRIGADVTAKIGCGNRSILHSWFGDVFDFVHRNILFYF